MGFLENKFSNLTVDFQVFLPLYSFEIIIRVLVITLLLYENPLILQNNLEHTTDDPGDYRNRNPILIIHHPRCERVLEIC